MDATAHAEMPANEPALAHEPGSGARTELLATLEDLSDSVTEAPCVIAGKDVTTGTTSPVRPPHRHADVVAEVQAATTDVVTDAIEAATAARGEWQAMEPSDRLAIFRRAADLLSGPWRARLNAATMLGQSKTIQQAEIDSACEMIDFWRFNPYWVEQIAARQPLSADGVTNEFDLRPLDGFVLAICPFNFTSIAGNLPTAPAMCGNTVVWKPSGNQALSAHLTMRLLQEAGLPDGVINLVHGEGALVAERCLADPRLAGLHFTGSAAVFKGLWQRIGANIGSYRQFPRIVGETGGKDFILAHASADEEALATAIIRGAFEYQGQKCSAASRMYVPASRWDQLRARLVDITQSLAMGDVADPTTFLGAVIDEKAMHKHQALFDRVAADPAVELVTGGWTDATDGWFVAPTILRTSDPRHETMTTEYFGPIITAFVYDDGLWEDTLELVDTTSPYGLTGAVFATDEDAIAMARTRLRFSAGNFYVNDKPTGAVVGNQPFGGARGSGTNDKAGSEANLHRWISPRIVKHNHQPPTAYGYPSMNV